MEKIVSLSMYPWPYSYRCGDCEIGKVKDGFCQNCGHDYRMKTCPECSTYYARGWDERGGCPACQGMIGYPASYLKSDKYKKKKKREKKKRHEKFLDAIEQADFFDNVPLLDGETFLQIAENWHEGDWRDGMAHEMVGILLRDIFERKRDGKEDKM